MSIEKPHISIIVPVYNVEKYLCKCLDSIIAQTFADFELLLIDDGSFDKSGQICDEYAQQDERIKVFHKENGGVSSARNLGLDKASGKWVAFIDSDDWVDDTYFEHLLEGEEQVELRMNGCFEQNRLLVWKKNLPERGLFINDNICSFYEQYLLSASFRSPWCKLFLSKIINANNIRFDISMFFGEDTIFTLNYLNQIKSILVVNYAEYYWRYTEGSLCDVTSIEKWEKFIDAFEREISAIQDQYTSSYLIRRHLAYRRFQFVVKQLYRLYNEEHLSQKERIQQLSIIFARLKKDKFNYMCVTIGKFQKIIVFLYYTRNVFGADVIFSIFMKYYKV